MPIDGWNEYKLLITSELARIDRVVTTHLNKCDESITNLNQSISTVNLKILQEINHLKTAITEKQDLELKSVNNRLTTVESKLSTIYGVAIFCGTAAGVIVGVLNFVFGNLL